MIATVILLYLAYTLFITLFDPEKLYLSWMGKIAMFIAFPGLLLIVGFGLLSRRFPIIRVIVGYAVLGFGIFFLVTALLIELNLISFCFFLAVGILSIILFSLGGSNAAK